MRETVPGRAVLDPSLLAEAVADPRRCGALHAWRDGRIRLVLTRRMLGHSLGLLGRLGLTEDTLRRWALWLTDPARVVLLEPSAEGISLREEYLDAARRGRAALLLTSRPDDFRGMQAVGIRIADRHA